MKTTVVPAQITTVEDRIIGNLTFAQILMLIVPLITSTAIYAVLAPRLHLSAVKAILIVIQFVIFDLLAVRINGKILADWLIIFTRYSRRPRVYLFTKNDLTTREVALSIAEKITVPDQPANKVPVIQPPISFADKIKLDQLQRNPAVTMRLAIGKKGGVDVSLKPVQK